MSNVATDVDSLITFRAHLLRLIEAIKSYLDARGY